MTTVSSGPSGFHGRGAARRGSGDGVAASGREGGEAGEAGGAREDGRLDGRKPAGPSSGAGGHSEPASGEHGRRGERAAAAEGASGPGGGSGRSGARRSALWGDGLIARRAPERAADGGADGGAGRSGESGRPSGSSAPGSAGGSRGDSASARSRGADRGSETDGDECDLSGLRLAVQAAQQDDRGDTASIPGQGGGQRGDAVLRRRFAALRELIGLSRPRLQPNDLAEAQRLLDEADARGRLPRTYTTVALAGATGSGKSALFNALAGAELSESGVRRPTTSSPVACTWLTERDRAGESAGGLLDRLEVAQAARRLPRVEGPSGMVLVDLPDHDSVAEGHREVVDRLLARVDAVVWVVDPEKYADAVLHERYLRKLAGYAEVTFVVLNQADRLPGEAEDAVLDDLRRLLDEDGMALGEHGEPGACVQVTSALTGQGVEELREELENFVSRRRAAVLRLRADLDGVTERLRPLYAESAPGATGPTGLTERAREDFEDRLATAVGAVAAGQAAERGWLRQAENACGLPWSGLVRWLRERAKPALGAGAGTVAGWRRPAESDQPSACAAPEPVARPVVAQAVRELADRAAVGLPQVWGKSVREAAWRGADGLPEALDELVRNTVGDGGAGSARVAEAPVRAAAASEGGLEGRTPRGTGGGADAAAGNAAGNGVPQPPWWAAARAGQRLLVAVQAVGLLWLLGSLVGLTGGTALPAALLVAGAAGGPLLAWLCRLAARGPARAHGRERERTLRRGAARCGGARVLEPVAAELLRYREVREQYVIAADGVRYL